MEKMNNDETMGIVKISDEVVSVIAGIAAQEIKGVVDLQHISNNISQLLKGKKSSGKNVKVILNEDNAAIDLYLSVEYGIKIPEVVRSFVQEKC